MPKQYTVETTNGDKRVVGYRGGSRSHAAMVATAIRFALAIGKGTAEVALKENGIPDVVCSVRDGEAFLSLIGGVAANNKLAMVNGEG